MQLYKRVHIGGVPHLSVLELRVQSGDIFTQLDVLSLRLVQQARHAVQLHLAEMMDGERWQVYTKLPNM